MYVCMYVGIDNNNVSMHVCMCMYECKYVCMCVCIRTSMPQKLLVSYDNHTSYDAECWDNILCSQLDEDDE